ncbi:MAG: 30S ribosome-binding factor RbfA [Planctomycetota bacterium]|nr:30S ribosome-binding factor RbfA [Planctomycetota bacterium]
MSLHTEQVASVLHRAVQQVITRGLNDPRVQGLISVTGVQVSQDLADATVSVSVMPAERAELTLHGLRHAARHIRTEVGRSVRMRRVPRLSFKLDESLKKEARVIAAINKAVEADERRRRPDEHLPEEEAES